MVLAAMVARLSEGTVHGLVAAAEAAEAEPQATAPLKTLVHRRVLTALAGEVMTVAESALFIQRHDAEMKNIVILRNKISIGRYKCALRAIAIRPSLRRSLEKLQFTF